MSQPQSISHSHAHDSINLLKAEGDSNLQQGGCKNGCAHCPCKAKAPSAISDPQKDIQSENYEKH